MIGLVMARANLPAKKYKKSNPTQLRISFELPAETGVSSRYIDIARALSIVNRKFYRQGLYYYVNSVEVYNDEKSFVDFLTIPDTWVTRNAWKRGFQLFQKMNSMVDDPISGIGRPKYHDFKVKMVSSHNDTTAPAITNNNAKVAFYGHDGVISYPGNSEWVHSKFTSADSNQDSDGQADQFTVHMTGEHSGQSGAWTSIGLIKSYADSRTTVALESPESDVIAPQDPLMNIFDFSDEEQMNDIIDNLRDDNDNPPYDRDDYIGEFRRDLNQVARIGTEEGLGRVGRASGFCAPFGLICVDTDARTTLRVVLNIAPGTYHGVYAERV
jgi:hypothetical protein